MNLVKISCLYQYILCVVATLPLLLGNDHILVDLSVVYQHTVLLQSTNQLQLLLRIKEQEGHAHLLIGFTRNLPNYTHG